MALSPLPSLPYDPSIPDATLFHLSSLPETLESLSPPLAALHRARLRLLLQIPAAPYYPSPDSMKGPGRWCHLCGGLREGLGGTNRGKKRYHPYSSLPTSSSSSSASNERDQGEAGHSMTGGPSTATSSATQMQMQKQRKPGTCATCNAAYSPPKPDLSTLKSYPRRTARKPKPREKDLDPGPTPSQGRRSPHSLASQRPDLHQKVQELQARGMQVKPKLRGDEGSEEFEKIMEAAVAAASAALAERERERESRDSLLFETLGEASPSKLLSDDTSPAAKTEIQDDKMDVDVDKGTSLISEDTKDDTSPAEIVAEQEDGSTTPLITDIAAPTQTRHDAVDTAPKAEAAFGADDESHEIEIDITIPPRPTLLSRPSLQYLPRQSPNLPTYPQPPPRVQPNTTPARAGAGKAGGAAVAGGKRKKRSGLAKLLAENKEREQGSGGLWGLN